jgi:hypothetical protein
MFAVAMDPCGDEPLDVFADPNPTPFSDIPLIPDTTKVAGGAADLGSIASYIS